MSNYIHSAFVTPDLSPQERQRQKNLRAELHRRRNAGEQNIVICNGTNISGVFPDSSGASYKVITKALESPRRNKTKRWLVGIMEHEWTTTCLKKVQIFTTTKIIHQVVSSKLKTSLYNKCKNLVSYKGEWSEGETVEHNTRAGFCPYWLAVAELASIRPPHWPVLFLHFHRFTWNIL